MIASVPIMADHFNKDFWLAAVTMGPVMFVAIGVMMTDAYREPGEFEQFAKMPKPLKRLRVARVVLFAIALGQAALATIDGVISLARGSDFGVPAVNAGALVASVIAFVALVFVTAFYRIESGRIER